MDIFRKNGYPVNFTDFCIMKYLNKREVYLLAPKNQLTAFLPFLGKKSLPLRSRLVNSVNKTVKKKKIKLFLQFESSFSIST